MSLAQDCIKRALSVSKIIFKALNNISFHIIPEIDNSKMKCIKLFFVINVVMNVENLWVLKFFVRDQLYLKFS